MSESTALPEVQGELRGFQVGANEGSGNVNATIGVPIAGVVTQQIGSGEHAQNSIVYKTILWCFIGGGLLSAASIIIALYNGRTSVLDEIKDVWSIFAPLITLALGYLFGKGR